VSREKFCPEQFVRLGHAIWNLFLGRTVDLRRKTAYPAFLETPKLDPLSTENSEKLGPFSDPDSGSGLVLNVSPMASTDC
jgi:hypothetical protein